MYGSTGNVWYTGNYVDGKEDGEFFIYDSFKNSGKLINQTSNLFKWCTNIGGIICLNFNP